MCMDLPVVGFSTTNLFISRLIRWATDAPVSHAWFEYTDHDMGGRWVLEAGPAGVVRVPFERVAQGWMNVNRFILPHHDLMVGIRAAAQRCGNKYGFLQAGGVGIRALLRRMGYRIRNPFANRKKEICSELVALGLMAMQLPGTEAWDHESLDPMELMTFCIMRESDLFQRTHL